ncbi:MAG: hypothetical protein ACYSWQ_06660 [Planctomycetota bacterium]
MTLRATRSYVFQMEAGKVSSTQGCCPSWTWMGANSWQILTAGNFVERMDQRGL